MINILNKVFLENEKMLSFRLLFGFWLVKNLNNNCKATHAVITSQNQRAVVIQITGQGARVPIPNQKSVMLWSVFNPVAISSDAPAASWPPSLFHAR